MSHNAFAYSAESVFVVEERRTCLHGMARHSTRIGAADMCALSRSPTTEDSEEFESVHRKSEGERHVWDVLIAYVHVPDTYVCRIR